MPQRLIVNIGTPDTGQTSTPIKTADSPVSVVQVPFVETGCDLEATLSAIPRATLACRGLYRLNAGIDGRVLRGLTVREEWDQSPPQGVEFSSAVDRADNRNQLSGGDVIARSDVLLLADEIELPLD